MLLTLTATVSPVDRSTPLYTWPRLAAAMGCGLRSSGQEVGGNGLSQW